MVVHDDTNGAGMSINNPLQDLASTPRLRPGHMGPCGTGDFVRHGRLPRENGMAGNLSHNQVVKK